MRIRTIIIITVLGILGISTRAATNIFNVGNNGFTDYTMNGVNDPDLTLVRGFTYVFNINVASIHPFWIKTVQGIGTGNAYTNGVIGNGTFNGTLQFAVPTNAPSLLYYNCQTHASMTGKLNIVNPPAVHIVGFSAGTNVMIQSTGTDALNISMQTSSNLMAGGWVPASMLSNIFADGTNTTLVVLPAGKSAFFRVLQGFF